MPFPPGSIVKRRLTGYAGLFFYHMGIYVGDNTVVHFGGEKKSVGALLLEDPLDAFAAGRPVVLHAAPKTPTHGAAICAEARRMYRDTQNGYNGRYHYVYNNCEDFCVAAYQACHG